MTEEQSLGTNPEQDNTGQHHTVQHHAAPYNYDSFIPANFLPWMRFHESPPLGTRGPDFPLWDLDGAPTTLHEILRQHTYTVVEFGSFT